MATYAALRLYVDSWRWEGVPFYVRAGKALAVTCTEVVIELKNPPQVVFREPPPKMGNTIRLRLSQGKTPDQIRQELAVRYGDDIQLIPPASGVAGLVWVLPVAAFIVALGGLALAFRHWRRPVTASATAADVDLVDRALHEQVDQHSDDEAEGTAPDEGPDGSSEPPADPDGPS